MLGVGALGLACVLVVAACGAASSASNPPATTTTGDGATTTTPGGSATTTTPTGTATNPSSGFAAYRSCLTSHGMTGFAGGGFFRRGGNGAGGTTSTTPGGAGTRPFTRPALSAADRKALAACASLRPTGGFGGFGRGGFAASNPKFAACLKAHGVQVGSPGSTTPGGFGSSNFRSAFSACRSLLPNGGNFGGGGFGRGFGAGSAGGGGTNSATFARYQACLRAHGVQPGAGAASSQAKLGAAIAACRSTLSGGGSGAGGSTTTTG